MKPCGDFDMLVCCDPDCEQCQLAEALADDFAEAIRTEKLRRAALDLLVDTETGNPPVQKR